MRRSLTIVMSLLIALCLAAQGNGFDMQVLSDPVIQGSARYVGLAGAMTALGGDASAVKDNPAALGVFRCGEVLLSADMTPTANKTQAGRLTKVPVTISELSWVICRRNDTRKRGLLSYSLQFDYHRVRNFASESYMAANLKNASQTFTMAALTDGLSPDALSSSGAYDNNDIGWLSKMGFDAWLIDTIPGTNLQWWSLMPSVADTRLSVVESGSMDDFSMAWGANISHCCYIGLGAKLRSLNYRKETTYSEYYENGEYYTLSSSATASGLGCSFQVGVIGRPLPWLRLAASLETPIWSTLTFGSYGSINSKVQGQNRLMYYSSESPTYTQQEKVSFPLRTTAGMAFTLGTKGLLSVEYDYQHRVKRKKDDVSVLFGARDAHLIKVGGEWVVRSNWFMQAGYAVVLYGRYAKDEEGEPVTGYYPGMTTTRTDTEWRYTGPKHMASVGCEYKNKSWVIGLAYQLGMQSQQWYATADHEYMCKQGKEEPFSLTQMTHRIVLTAAWRH